MQRGATLSFEIPRAPEPLAILRRDVGALRRTGLKIEASPEPYITPGSAPFWRFDVAVPRHEAAYCVLLGTLVKVNTWCRSQWLFPPLYESGIVYQEQPLGIEWWRSLPALYARGHGDCDNLVAARIAELHEMGVPSARPRLLRRGRIGTRNLYHWDLAYRDGGRLCEEDPSLILTR